MPYQIADPVDIPPCSRFWMRCISRLLIESEQRRRWRGVLDVLNKAGGFTNEAYIITEQASAAALR